MKSVQLPTIFNVAAHFVDRHISEGRGERIAYECGDERVSYRQLFERVNRAGNALKKLGIRPEERVGLLLLDTPEFPYCFFGAIKIGAVPIPINTLLKPGEYEYILNDSRVRVLIVSEALVPQIEAIDRKKLRYLKTIVVFGNAPEGMESLQQLLDGKLRLSLRPSRRPRMMPRSGCTLQAAPASPKAACICIMTWWYAPSCTPKTF